MTVEPLPMTLLHDRMPEWWRPLALDLDGEIVNRRARGVEALRAALSPSNAVDAVAYAHGDDRAGTRIIDLVCEAARTADAGYGARVWDAEPPALVAAALADQLAVDPDSDLSTLVALLVLSGSYNHASPAIATMPLSDYAQSALEHRSALLRRPAPPAQETAGELVSELLAGADHRHSERYAGANNGDSTATLDRTAATSIAAGIDRLASGAEREITALREQLRQEAWVSDPCCQTAGGPWAEVEPAARPLLAAVELADHTFGITPASGAQTLLRRLLPEPVRSFGLDETTAVAAAGPLLEGRLTCAPHPLLFPLSTRLAEWRARQQAEPADGERRLLAGLDDDWSDELEIALQTYREALALRALGHD